jgi:hypothetical protein
VIRAFALATALILCIGIAAADAMTPGEYARAVAGAAQGLEQAAKAGKQSKPLATAALDRLPRRVVVRQGPTGPAVEVDNRELIRDLREQVVGGRSGIKGAARVLRNLERSIGPRAQPAAADARTVLAGVLRGKDFKPSRIESIMARITSIRDRVVSAIGRFIDRVLRGIRRVLRPLSKYAPDVALPRDLWHSVAVVLVAVILAIIIYLIVRLVLRIIPRGPAPQRVQAPEPVPIRPHADWLADAESALRAGDYRSALRALHMAALMRLDEGGFIRYMDSRTDGRFTRALRDSGRHDLAETLAAISTPFAAVWYGAAPARPGDYVAAQEHWKRLEALATT